MDDLDNEVAAEDIGIPLPPGRWRLGVPCPHTKVILMRFAHCKETRHSGIRNPVEMMDNTRIRGANTYIN